MNEYSKCVYAMQCKHINPSYVSVQYWYLRERFCMEESEWVSESTPNDRDEFVCLFAGHPFSLSLIIPFALFTYISISVFCISVLTLRILHGDVVLLWKTWWLLRKPLDAADLLVLLLLLVYSYFFLSPSLSSLFGLISLANSIGLTTSMRRSLPNIRHTKWNAKTRKKNKRSYAFCLFCSCFRSQEILFIFIEPKDFSRK